MTKVDLLSFSVIEFIAASIISLGKGGLLFISSFQ